MNNPPIQLYVLWRPEPDEPPNWHLVDCTRVKARRAGFTKIPFAQYRRWRYVFIVHVDTGLNCGVGLTLQDAWNMIYKAAEGMTVKQYLAMIEYAVSAGNYPKRPSL